jgi:hypothetical protein
MPLHINLQGQKSPITFRASDALSTVFNFNGDAEAVLPWLMIGPSVRNAQWLAGNMGGAIEMNLHPLGDREKLIVLAEAGSADLHPLFPGMTLISSPLDTSHPLLKPGCAWESLDAVVLGPAAMGQVEDEQVQTLLAAGTTLIVRTSTRPDERWPWKALGNLWVLRHESAGPAPCIDADVYDPTYSLDRGWPLQFRREIVLWAALICIVILAVSLWRSRWTVWGCILACIVAAVVFAWRYSRQSPVLQLQTGIAINQRDLTQIDLWSWRTTLRETDASVPATGLTYPMFTTAGQVEQMNLQMICGADGNPERLQFHLMPGQSLAILRRLVRPKLPFGPLVPVAATWQQFAQDLYLRPGDRIAGQTSIANPSTGQNISTTVLDRQ